MENSLSSKLHDDKRELYTLVREDRERIASLEGLVESLASSVETGFKNINSRIDDLVQAQRSSRPQLGIIATILISATALIISLAGFALKSSVQPLTRDLESHQRRLSLVEESLKFRYSDHDDVQDARINENSKIIDEFNRLMLQNYVTGSVGAARNQHEHLKQVNPNRNATNK